MAFPYQDNGVYYVFFMDCDGNDLDTLNVSDQIGIDKKSIPVNGRSEPLITMAFIQDDNAMIAAYHRYERKQYFFTYNYRD